MMSFQAILFDLDGTLRHNDPPSIQYFYRLAAELGLETSEQTRLTAERWTHSYWASSEEMKSDLEAFGPWEDNAAFWTNHAKRHLMALHAPEDRAIELAPIITKMMQETYQPAEHVAKDVLPTMDHLLARGYRLAILSNRSKPYDDLVDRLALKEKVEFAIAAGELGAWKPKPEPFWIAASRLGVEPEQTIYVGDNYYADVVGARNAGMHPVLYDEKGLYPETDCVKIRALHDLPAVLGLEA